MLTLHSSCTAICKENAPVSLPMINKWFIVSLAESCVHNTSHLKGLKYTRNVLIQEKNRWRKKIATVCLLVSKACLFRIYCRLSSGRSHPWENITPVILPRAVSKSIGDCVRAAMLNMCRKYVPWVTKQCHFFHSLINLTAYFLAYTASYSFSDPVLFL